jgi:adenosylhomocysteine nucleosidase
MLAIVPTRDELDALLEGLACLGLPVEPGVTGRLETWTALSLGLSLALGGLGKAQFAVQTQHLLDQRRWDLALCVGAAGALADAVEIGDIVVATETIEHDVRMAAGKPVPRFAGDAATLAASRVAVRAEFPIRVHFGGVASGDEDVVDSRRRSDCRSATGALAVAWEGAGGARACAFSGVPFVEIRGITDNANADGPRDFRLNVRLAMQNVAAFLRTVAESRAGSD